MSRPSFGGFPRPGSGALRDSTEKTAPDQQTNSSNIEAPASPTASSKKENTSGNKDNSGKNQIGQGNTAKLDPKSLAVLNELKQTDQKVRAHETAHTSAGGQYVTGGPSFQYKTGPDGKQYAVGGEVEIDTSTIPNDPEATIAKMQVVKRAALAPSDPSPQDRSVAAAATQKEAQARLSEKSSTQTDNKMVGKNLSGTRFERQA